MIHLVTNLNNVLIAFIIYYKFKIIIPYQTMDTHNKDDVGKKTDKDFFDFELYCNFAC